LPSVPRRSILFAFWDGEEKGLLGSKHWVSQPTIPLSQVKTTINLDMIGRLRKGRLLVYGTRTSYGLRRLVSEQNTSPDVWLDLTWEMKADSDHYTFYERGIPTLMLHTDLHGEYHRPQDDAHMINPAGMEQLNRFLFNLAFELADGSRQFPFRTAARRESTDGRRALDQAVAPRPPRLGVRWKDETPQGRGVVISEVFRGSAGEAAGLRVGDRIVQFAGAPVESDSRLRRAVAISPSAVTAQIEREGEEQPLDIELRLSGAPVRLGVTWREDRAEPGTIIITSVAGGSPAQQVGVQPGDRIYQINSQDFANGEAFRHLATTLPGPLELVLERHGRLRTLSADVPETAAAE
jgi:hypothetical protein